MDRKTHCVKLDTILRSPTTITLFHGKCIVAHGPYGGGVHNRQIRSTVRVFHSFNRRMSKVSVPSDFSISLKGFQCIGRRIGDAV